MRPAIAVEQLSRAANRARIIGQVRLADLIDADVVNIMERYPEVQIHDDERPYSESVGNVPDQCTYPID